MARAKNGGNGGNGGTAVAEAPVAQAPQASVGERVQMPTDNPNVVKVPYEIAGKVPESLVGLIVWTPEAKNVEGLTALVDEGKQEHIVKLAQSALDVNRQRVIRAACASKDVAEILAGEGEGNIDLSQDERVAKALEYVQTASDEYTYGSITRGTGDGKAQKAKEYDAAKERARVAVQNDPTLAAQLVAIFGAGFDLNA